MRISDWSSDVCSSDLSAKIGSATSPNATGPPVSTRCGFGGTIRGNRIRLDALEAMSSACGTHCLGPGETEPIASRSAHGILRDTQIGPTISYATGAQDVPQPNAPPPSESRPDGGTERTAGR